MLESGSNHLDSDSISKPLTTSENHDGSMDNRRNLRNQSLPMKAQNQFTNKKGSKGSAQQSVKSRRTSQQSENPKPYMSHSKQSSSNQPKQKKKKQDKQSNFLKEFNQRKQIDINDIRHKPIQFQPGEDRAKPKFSPNKKYSIVWGTPGGAVTSSESEAVAQSNE